MDVIRLQLEKSLEMNGPMKKVNVTNINMKI